MKKKLLRRIVAVSSSAVLLAGTAALFAGCTSSNPEITITYTFNGQDYEVDYKLSRLDAPKTVTHFLELVEAGYYDGTCVHDKQDAYFYMGGYTLDADGELDPIDYFTKVRELESSKKITFTQSVWKNRNLDSPLYTVYGEFDKNGNYPEKGRSLTHTAGALVMYYTPKGNFNGRVSTMRNDGGSGNNNDKYDHEKSYEYNSATSLFYTYTGERSMERENSYCVFGMASDYVKQFQPLLTAISDYIKDHTDEDAEENEYSFTVEKTISNVNALEQGTDPDYEALRRGSQQAVYNTPVEAPIIVKNIKINKL